MSHRSRAAVPVAAAVVACALGTWSAILLAQQPAGTGPAQAAATPQRAPQPGKPMNVQVLKDLSGAELHDAMVFIAASLGTNCGFCHVRTPQGEWAFDRDDKPEKKTARHMLQITRGLNAQYFDGRQTVTCSSCHQAHREPNPAPPLAQPAAPGQAEAMAGPARGEAGRGGPPPAPAQAEAMAAPGRGGRPPAPLETADQVVGKYLQALGGEERVRSVTSVVMRGTATNRAGDASPLLVEEAVPNRYRSTIESKPPSSRGYDGTAAWQQVAANVRPLEGVQLQYVAQLGDLGLALRLRDKDAGLSAARYDRVDGRDVIWLVARRGREITEMLAFDRASGLLVRRMVRLQTPLGRLPLEIDYADYRDVDGVKLPFDVRITDWEGIQLNTFSEVKLNAPIDESRFAAPK